MTKPIWLACMLCVGGCGNNPYFDDDEGAPRGDVSLVGDHPDQLSQPYVLGGKVHITAHNGDNNWRVRSDSPSVFSVDKLNVLGKDVEADCTAVAVGRANVVLVDGGGAEQRRVTVVVQSPDNARLFAHGPARLLELNTMAASAVEVSAAKILVGSPGVFAVTYYAGSQRLYGRGIANAPAQVGLTVQDMTSSGLPTNDWLFITPSLAGAYTVDVHGAGAGSLASLAVTGTDAIEVAGVGVSQEMGIHPNDKDNVWVLAQATDAAGQPVYGVYFNWTLDGVAQSDDDKSGNQGDLYRYQYDPNGAPRSLVATRGTVTGSLSIKAHMGSIHDTTFLGCSAVPGARPRGSWLWAVLVAAPLLRRRARRARG